MTPLRRLLRQNRPLATLLLAAALALRLLVPPGMMTMPAAGSGIEVVLCDGTGPAGRHVMNMAMPMEHGRDRAPMPGDHPCAFTALAIAVIGGAAAAFIVAAPLVQELVPIVTEQSALVSPSARYRPAQRGPPALA